MVGDFVSHYDAHCVGACGAFTIRVIGLFLDYIKLHGAVAGNVLLVYLHGVGYVGRLLQLYDLFLFLLVLALGNFIYHE